MNKDKLLLLDEVKAQIKNCDTFLVADCKKLDANKANEFRREIAKLGSSFEVVKKRLLQRALQEIGYECGNIKDAKNVGIIFTHKDVFESSKFIAKFCSENEDAFKLLFGRVDGSMISARDAEKLPSLPSKDELRAQFLQILEMPLSGTLSLFEAVLSGMVNCLEEKVKKEKE